MKAEDLKPDAFESPAKHAELRALLAAYERYLVEHNRGDWATVYEEAMQHPDWLPDPAGGLLSGAARHDLVPAAAPPDHRHAR